jgi:TonB family protein
MRTLAIAALLFAATALGSAQQVYSAKDTGVTLPRLTYRSQPRYTQEAWERRVQGTVTLDCDVLADGSVGAVLVTRSLDTTYGLDGQAVASVRDWKFQPGTKDGKPVPVRVSVEVKFTLARAPL